MTSLEIVKNMLNFMNKVCLPDVDSLPIRKEELELIKQDLEVLEIFKKGRFVGYQKFAGNMVIIDNITDEQYQQIREWLEEQE